MEFKVTLDREAFKVLASDTRLDILKALDERPMTVSELGRKLDLNKATVFEHLEKLVGAALVKKHDDGERKWVYYSLSWKARRILHPERVTIALLFSTSLGALLTGVTVAAEYLRQAAAETTQNALGGAETGTDAGPRAASPAAANQTAEAVSAPPPAPGPEVASAADPVLLSWAVGLLALCAVLALIGTWYWRQARRRAEAEAR